MSAPLLTARDFCGLATCKKIGGDFYLLLLLTNNN
jgi:hypothetical protein